jgi:hypothetical protein
LTTTVWLSFWGPKPPALTARTLAKGGDSTTCVTVVALLFEGSESCQKLAMLAVLVRVEPGGASTRTTTVAVPPEPKPTSVP